MAAEPLPQALALGPVGLLAEMRRLIEEDGDDKEAVHGHLDQAILKELRALGYGEAADLFDATPMWYA